jgi:hypothetical protein
VGFNSFLSTFPSCAVPASAISFSSLTRQSIGVC